jgi:hypothetical protein
MPHAPQQAAFRCAAHPRHSAKLLGGLLTLPASIRRGLIGPRWSSSARTSFKGLIWSDVAATAASAFPGLGCKCEGTCVIQRASSTAETSGHLDQVTSLSFEAETSSPSSACRTLLGILGSDIADEAAAEIPLVEAETRPQ